MAPRRTDYTPMNIHEDQVQDLDDTIHESEQYEQDQNEQRDQNERHDQDQSEHHDEDDLASHYSHQDETDDYILDESELDPHQQENMDAGTRAQTKNGRRAFGKRRAQVIEEQGTVEINARPTQNDVAWNKTRVAKRLTIADVWDPIDEEDAPRPKSMNATKFAKYPEDPLYGIDWTAANDPAFLRAQLTSMAQQFQQCRKDLADAEDEALQTKWDRSMTQKKNKRLESFAHHVVTTIALPIASSQTAREYRLQKREDAVAKRENLVNLERALMNREVTDYEKAMKRIGAEAKETIANVKQLRDDVLTDDAKLSKLRQDVMAEQEEDLFNERTEWQQAKAMHTKEISKKRRELDDERGASKHKKDIQISQEIKDEWYSQGYHMGLAEGKRFTAVEQYNRGYTFGSRHANKKTAKQNLDDAFTSGRQLGIEKTRKECDKIMETFQSMAHEKMSELAASAYQDGVDEASSLCGTLLQQRESAVRRNSRAYGMYEGAVNQIRRQNNVEGSEQEEDAMAALIAATMGEQITLANSRGNFSKICWYNASQKDSKLYTASPSLKNSSFMTALMPKLIAQATLTQERIAMEEQRLADREKAAADRKDEEWAARDAATREPEQDFERVKPGPLAPYRRQLPPVVEEPPESEEAQETSTQDMVATFLRNMRDG